MVGTAGGTKYGYDKDGKPFLTKEPKLLLNDNNAGKPEGIHLMIGRRPYAAFGNSTGDRQMLEYTKAGDGARLAMLVLHDDAKREYAYGPAQGLPDTKVGTFTQALYDEAKKQGWTVISMKNDWKRIFAFESFVDLRWRHGAAGDRRLYDRRVVGSMSRFEQTENTRSLVQGSPRAQRMSSAHPMSFFNDLLEKPANLSTESKYAVMNGYIYLMIGALLIVWPGAVQTIFMDRPFVGDEGAIFRVTGMALAVIGWLYVFGGRSGARQFGPASILDRVVLVPGVLVPLAIAGVFPHTLAAMAILDPALAIGAWVLHKRKT